MAENARGDLINRHDVRAPADIAGVVMTALLTRAVKKGDREGGTCRREGFSWRPSGRLHISAEES
jgi:hypothetical protein